ncbi:DNA polymerase sliding clamp [Halorussus sp. MSC15.2]|uniref:DNA polymerase sliding clamp n=1 Tax=Halorussus sp. MSC15.2 TaxID=2283638 RepID=UPI0013D5B8D8|nr:DNA polymerase sliding clamp [Halorussus sp. MSC15.2]NEU57861.1 DNA polymerase sliding clamp [Halorussus sp. MSC15.2]
MSESVSDADAPEAPTRSFRATVNADAIQTAVDLVAALLDECHLSFDEDGVRMWGMDPATVASVDLTLERAAFDDYEATGVRSGVDLSRLGDVVGMADSGQSVHLELDHETRTLEIRFGGLEYALTLIDPETIRRPPDRPSENFDFAGGVVADTDDFDWAVRAADMVSDHLALGIDAEEDAFFVEAEGDTDDVSLVLTADDLVEVRPGEARSLFSLDYLSVIGRAMPSDLDVDLRLGTEQPVAIEYEFADEAGSVAYFVAPRISRR